MSSRNRQRPNHNQDADEERRLWNEIRANAKKIDAMVAKSAELSNEIVEVEERQAALVESGELSSTELDSRLESLYRENLRISETAQAHIEGAQLEEMNLLDSIKILAGLREASEEASRNSFMFNKSRNATLKRKAGVVEDGEEGSAAPSPRPGNGGRDRLGVEKKEKRGGSVSSTREVSVKIEDGAESVTSSVDGSKQKSMWTAASSLAGRGIKVPVKLRHHPTFHNRHPKPTPTPEPTLRLKLKLRFARKLTSTSPEPAPSEPSRRLTLAMGAMVFYKNKGRASEGEGILCRVTSVIGEGKQRRYEIQDADPEPDPTTGDLPAPYRASVAHLVPIPKSNEGMPDLAKGKSVLAQYPDTTTFYKAEVSVPWRSKEISTTDRGEYVRLRFEGETEETIWQEVERRFVLVDK